MGVSARIYLPNDVDARTLGRVIAVLAGDDFERSKYGAVNPSGLKVEGIKSIPGCCEITINGGHWCMYHYDIEDSNYRLLNPPSTPFWIAVGKKLCEFFGGKIDYNDCDERGCNKRWKKTRKNNPSDDGPWDRQNNRIAKLKPITKKDLEMATKYAYYKVADVNEK